MQRAYDTLWSGGPCRADTWHLPTSSRCYYESVTIRPQNSSQAQNPKTPNPNRKLIIQISKDEFVWDESSDSRYNCIVLEGLRE